MFWDQNQEAGTPVYTQYDLDTSTHIVYLDVPAAAHVLTLCC